MADGRVVVTDFGLATDARDGASTVHGGTVSYMAPELLRGGRSSVASDLWALGVVMHEIVFGVKPRWSEGPAPEMLAARPRPQADRTRRTSSSRRAAPARSTIPSGGCSVRSRRRAG